VSSNFIGVSGLSGRYGTALFELAVAEKKLDQVADDVQTLAVMLDESADLERLVKSPVISREEQGAAIDAVLDASGVGGIVRQFAGVVAENRRLFVLSGMLKAFQVLLANHRGEVTAEVISAKKLTKEQLKSITGKLKQSMGTKVAVDAKVDADLLGGMIVKVGSRMIDSSLRSRLQSLRLTMKGVQ